MINSTLPSLRKFSIFAIDDTNDTKIIGTTQQYNKFRKILAIGVRTSALGPKIAPMADPINIPARRIKENL
jgi:hypothetical protein